jgi:hypothetical protein
MISCLSGQEDTALPRMPFPPLVFPPKKHEGLFAASAGDARRHEWLCSHGPNTRSFGGVNLPKAHVNPKSAG